MWKWFFVCFTAFLQIAENPLEGRYIHIYPEIIACFAGTDYVLGTCSVTHLLITSTYEKKKHPSLHKLRAVTSQKIFWKAFHYFIVLLLLFVHFRKFIFEILLFQYYSKIGYSSTSGRKYFRLFFSELLLQKSQTLCLSPSKYQYRINEWKLMTSMHRLLLLMLTVLSKFATVSDTSIL